MKEEPNAGTFKSRLGGAEAAPCFVFFLQPEFPINALILASEALRIANQNSGRGLFVWHYASADGAPVRASNGMWMEVEFDLKGLPKVDYLFLFEGNLPTQRNSPALLAKLRSAERYGTRIAAVDTAAFAFAQSGLLCDRKAVLHWEAKPTFQECFPEIPIKDALYDIDDTAISCGGGVATLDLMLDLIGRIYDEALANEVANALVHTRRPADRPQRLDGRPTPGEPSLSARIIDLMERNLDFPLSPIDLAGRLDISVRSLERHSQRPLPRDADAALSPDPPPGRAQFPLLRGHEPERHFDRLRLSYPSVFSRAFKDHFGQTPSDFRKAIRSQQDQSLRPEIRRLALTPPIR